MYEIQILSSSFIFQIFFQLDDITCELILRYIDQTLDSLSVTIDRRSVALRIFGWIGPWIFVWILFASVKCNIPSCRCFLLSFTVLYISASRQLKWPLLKWQPVVLNPSGPWNSSFVSSPKLLSNSRILFLTIAATVMFPYTTGTRSFRWSIAIWSRASRWHS